MMSKNSFKDFLFLTKPGIIFGNLITALSGYFLASKGDFNFSILLFMLLGLSFVIASGCIFNNIIDKQYDKIMERTKNRALAKETISNSSAFIFGLICHFIGLYLLIDFVNLKTAAYAFAGFFTYVFIYSVLKYKTSVATLLGSISGAIPPVVGYCSVTNQIDAACVVLFFIVVFWQMPHFYAISLYRLEDYKKANIPVLPLVRGIKTTQLEMFFYVIGYFVACSSLYFLSAVGNLYFIGVTLIGLMWLINAFRGFNCLNVQKWAKNMFKLSLVAVMVVSFLISYDWNV
jgi:protoheme IX farnesyltransferase